VKKGGLERAHSECLVSAKALAHAYAGAERKRIKGGNREGVSILGQVDEDLEERRESAKLNRMRFQCDSYRRKWSVWNAAGCRFKPHLLDALSSIRPVRLQESRCQN
jgi:hypothetical protein